MDALSLLRLIVMRDASDASARTGALPAGELRFILEFGGQPDIGLVETRLAALVGASTFMLERFDESLLPDFLVLRFPHVESTLPQRDLFAISYALADALQVRSIEPDLQTSYYIEPRPPGATATAEAAQAVGALCWVSGAPPADLRWALTSARIPAAWEHSRGHGVIVAQPDSGVARHAELDGGMLRLDLARDILGNDVDPTDPLDPNAANPGHGTGTASVVASREHGRMAGAAPEAQLVPIRCLTDVKIFSPAPVTAAILHAVKARTHIISMSLGGVPSKAMHRAIEQAIANDMIVIAAAGNCVRMVVWPARYDDVIAVAGTNIADKPWKGSSRGGSVDIAAPAELVWRAERARTSDPEDRVAPGQGTSFATALVAGIAALWLSRHGRDHVIAEARRRGTSVQSLFRRAMKATARKPEDWDADDFGPGIIDAGKLLALALTDIPAGGVESDVTTNPVGALLTEEFGPGVRDMTFPADRFELELAAITLAQASLSAAPDTLSETSKWPATRPSPDLDAAVRASPDRRLRRFGTEPATAIVRPTLPAPAILAAAPMLPADQARIDRVGAILTTRPGDRGGDEKLLATLDRALRDERAGLLPERGPRVVAEALIRLIDRPALRVRDGRILSDSATAGGWHDQLILLAATDILETNLARVGRIDAGGAHVGTGFVAGPGLVLTNRHVVQMIAAPVPRRQAPDHWVLTEAATIDFADEPSSQTTRSCFRITEIVSAGPDPIEFDGIDLRHLDVALLAVETINAEGTHLPGPLLLDRNLGAASAKRPILVSGYPAPPPTLPLNAQGDIDEAILRRLGELYRADYGTKYVAPGEIAVAPGHHPLDQRQWIIAHDATTLVGNSGSALLAMTGAQNAIGLHFGGQWMRENYAHSLAALHGKVTLPGFADLHWSAG